MKPPNKPNCPKNRTEGHKNRQRTRFQVFETNLNPSNASHTSESKSGSAAQSGTTETLDTQAARQRRTASDASAEDDDTQQPSIPSGVRGPTVTGPHTSGSARPCGRPLCHEDPGSARNPERAGSCASAAAQHPHEPAEWRENQEVKDVPAPLSPRYRPASHPRHSAIGRPMGYVPFIHRCSAGS